MLPGTGSFLEPARGGHWVFQVQRVFRNWELMLRNGDGLEETAERIHGKDESSMIYHNLLSSLGIIGQRMRRGHNTQNWECDQGFVCLPALWAYLLLWQALLVGSQGISVGVGMECFSCPMSSQGKLIRDGGWIKLMSWEKFGGEYLCDLLEVGS